MNKLEKKLFLGAVALLSCALCYADADSDNGYSPYSKFGIGTLNRPGTSINTAMGGVGTAMRDNRHINILNPAAVTARDSLAFMADFCVSQGNSYFSQGNVKSVNNTFNISNFVMSFPIWKSSAFMIGINPFSSVAYKVSRNVTDPQVIGYTDNITDILSGNGSLYQVFLGAGVTFWKRLSLGAQFDYYFGTLEKSSSRTFSSDYYGSIYSGQTMIVRGFGGKFGIQYQQPFSNGDKAVIGATYRLSNKLGGDYEDLSYAIQSEITDTLTYKSSKIENVFIPSEISVGLSYRHLDIWSLEINGTYSDWRGSKSNMDAVEGFKTGLFTSGQKLSVNAGATFTPNRNDIRYYLRKCTYRFGAYYTKEHFQYAGQNVNSAGVTFGMTFPVFRWSNGITFSLDLGQRGRTQKGTVLTNTPVRERYINFSVSLNVFDIWFIKPKYE